MTLATAAAWNQLGPSGAELLAYADRVAPKSWVLRIRGAGVLLPPSQFEAWFVSAAHDDDAIEATLEAATR